MGRPSATSEGSIATFLFALVALNPPVLSVFSVEVFLFGVPLLYLYLLAVWLLIVALVAWIALGAPKAGTPDGAGQSVRSRRGSENAR